MNLVNVNNLTNFAIKYRRSLISISIFLIITILMGIFSKKEQPIQSVESVDTIIPKGHSLIPIEIQNKEALDTMMGPYAIIDLFTFNSQENAKGKKIASSVKLLRAPLDQQQFGVLITDEEAQSVLTNNGPYFVVLKSPNEKKAINKLAKKNNSIVID